MNPTGFSQKTKAPASHFKQPFEEFLVSRGYLSQKQLADARLRQGQSKKTLEQAMVEQKLLSEEKLTRAKAEFFHLPYVDLMHVSIPKEVLAVIPKETLENYRFLPFTRAGRTVKVALTNPTDLRSLEALEFFAQQNKYKVELYLTSPANYERAFQQSQTISTEVGEALHVMAEKEKLATVPSKARTLPATEERRLTAEAPIARIVDVVIRHAIEARASDIHVEPQEKELRIRYRVDGILHSSLVVPKIVHPGIVSRVKILSNLKIDEQRLPQDGRFHMDIENHSIDFRVSTLPTVNGEKVVMRILDKSGGVPTLPELGLIGMKLERLMENIKKTHGMLLVTGPTGSGKSTTLYAVLNILNKIGVNIVTLEDPVEYYVDGVNQSQINPDIGLTFASGLRSILRQDPNIIMVGEIRDRETAELAVHSALTGHLVFSTLHTNDALGAVPRLLDMGIEPFLLTASLNSVVGQRLVRKICPDCRKEVKPVPEEVKKIMTTELKNIPKGEAGDLDLTQIKIYVGQGCKACGDTGYRGRIAIFEVLDISPRVRELILERETGAKLKAVATTEGMISMMQDGLLKVLQGVTTMEELLRVTKE